MSSQQHETSITSPAQAQPTQAFRIPLIGEAAPAFTAVTTQGAVHFPDDYKGKWVILFSHPADFTPVCTTEFMAFATLMPQFDALNCKLLGLSIDSNYSHIAWLRTIKEKIKYKVATPADWRPGDDVIVPPPGSCGVAQERMTKPAEDTRCLDWFLCLKRLPKEASGVRYNLAVKPV